MVDFDAWLEELEQKRQKKKEKRREIASKKEELGTNISNEKKLDEMIYKKKRKENYKKLKQELKELKEN